jgi:quinol monooxygenase YgiN
MLLYEVNITPKPEIYADYLAWLRGHVQAMLALEGFKHAQIYQVEPCDAENTPQTLCVQYLLADRTSLTTYFADHAEAQRASVPADWQDKLTITRRVLETI